MTLGFNINTQILKHVSLDLLLLVISCLKYATLACILNVAHVGHLKTYIYIGDIRFQSPLLFFIKY